MEEMIAAQVELPYTIAKNMSRAEVLAEQVTQSASDRAPIVATGCGTAGHAAQGLAAVLNEAFTDTGHDSGALQWRPAFEAACAPWRGGICLAVSESGRSKATVAALQAAHAAGARTALITAARDTPAYEAADEVLEIGIADRSWCHTVGYLGPIVAAAAIAAAIRHVDFEPEPLAHLLEAALSSDEPFDHVAASIANSEHVLVAGSGADLVAARELALKIDEGAWLPASAYELEDILHGHLVGHGDRTALVVLATASEADPHVSRTESLLRTARRIGLTTALIANTELAARIDGELTSAGRIAVQTSAVPTALASLVGSGIALQRLTLASRIGRLGNSRTRSTSLSHSVSNWLRPMHPSLGPRSQMPLSELVRTMRLHYTRRSLMGRRRATFACRMLAAKDDLERSCHGTEVDSRFR
jgi:glucosamine--fructose-6-phosphate aminotransferase (isomerizing)